MLSTGNCLGTANRVVPRPRTHHENSQKYTRPSFDRNTPIRCPNSWILVKRAGIVGMLVEKLSIPALLYDERRNASHCYLRGHDYRTCFGRGIYLPRNDHYGLSDICQDRVLQPCSRPSPTELQYSPNLKPTASNEFVRCYLQSLPGSYF